MMGFDSISSRLGRIHHHGRSRVALKRIWLLVAGLRETRVCDSGSGWKPRVWLFEGQKAGEHYSATSLGKLLEHALKKAGIRKPVTLHWLRQSYATHFWEGGTDLRYIQELLGYKSSKTTEIYTHVSEKSIQKIVTPYDTLEKF